MAPMSRIDPQVLAFILPALADLDESRPLNLRPISVPTHRILAWAWKPGRLADCTERLAAGEQAPPVYLTRYMLLGENWYTVSDGMHRTVAARNAGRKRIRAVVSCETPCRPERCVLQDGRLWRKKDDPRFGPCLQLVPVDLEPAHVEALRAVGVAEVYPC